MEIHSRDESTIGIFYFFFLRLVHCISFGLQFLPDHRGTTGAEAPDTASLDSIALVVVYRGGYI